MTIVDFVYSLSFVLDSRNPTTAGRHCRLVQNIDLVIEDEFAGTLDFREVKIDPARYNATSLEAKIAMFLAKNPTKKSLRQTCGCLSLNDM